MTYRLTILLLFFFPGFIKTEKKVKLEEKPQQLGEFVLLVCLFVPLTVYLTVSQSYIKSHSERLKVSTGTFPRGK